MATTATQQMSEAELNQINGHLKQQPWYQQFFAQRGLDLNRVKLSEAQRAELTNLAARNGYELGDRMKFDEAGNMNQKGGFAGMPQWAKIAISAAPVAASMLVPGVREATIGQMGSIFGGGAKAIPMLASHTAGTVASGGTPNLFSKIAGKTGDFLSMGGRALSASAAAQAANRGTMLDATMEHDKLALDADRERRSAENDAYRKSLFGQLAAGYQPSTRPAGIPAAQNSFVTPEARQAGQLMYDTAMQRMKAQDYPAITPMSQLPVKPGAMERIASYAAPALSLFDPRLYQKQNGQQ